jgi:Raf kinase inhibitor-like YbhB/YbcL family protein
MQRFQLHSPAIRPHGTIPIRFTCDGANVSPPLTWSKPPRGTESLVLIVDDPDAVEVTGHTVTHYVLVNLHPRIQRLMEGQALNGLSLHNERHQLGWMGPCPPQGSTHRYRFTLYALTVNWLPLPNTMKLTSEFFEHYFGRFVVGKAQFDGYYRRR